MTLVALAARDVRLRSRLAQGLAWDNFYDPGRFPIIMKVRGDGQRWTIMHFPEQQYTKDEEWTR